MTVEAAAFVESDPQRLVEIGLSYLPGESLTARCILAAVASHRAGEDWLTARQRVLEVGRHPNAQFSPPNIAFQVVGWLYGAEFGDAVCKAVNCGYDTDCTGATLGAVLGIVGGASSLPQKWTAPLGETIATSDPHGVKNIYLSPHPAPRSLGELTDRILELERQVTARFGPVAGGDMLLADAAILRQIAEPPTRIATRLGPRLHLDLDYGRTPQIGADATTEVGVTIHHQFPEETPVDLQVEPAEGWSVEPAGTSLVLQSGTDWNGSVRVRSPRRAALANATPVLFRVQPRNRPATVAVPLVFVGARAWLRAGPFSGEGKSAAELLDQAFPPETRQGSLETAEGRGGGWRVVEADGNDLGPCVRPFGQGVVYLRAFLHDVASRAVFLHVSATAPAKVWVNEQVVIESRIPRILRPNANGNGVEGVTGGFETRHGWNEILIKIAADAPTPPVECHVVYSDRARQYAGIVDLRWTAFPWDANV